MTRSLYHPRRGYYKRHPHSYLWLEVAERRGMTVRKGKRDTIEIVPLAAIDAIASIYELDPETASRQLWRMEREKRIVWEQPPKPKKRKRKR